MLLILRTSIIKHISVLQLQLVFTAYLYRIPLRPYKEVKP
uniref:Uncharacterized protein n=1 Tax=Staphylococcus phage 184DA TaxID=3110532 RepID=A0AAU6MXS2_9CAUD